MEGAAPLLRLLLLSNSCGRAGLFSVCVCAAAAAAAATAAGEKRTVKIRNKIELTQIEGGGWKAANFYYYYYITIDPPANHRSTDKLT